MLAFFFKKNLCDGWDNLFTIIVSNVFSLALFVAAVAGIVFAQGVHPLLGAVTVVVASGIVMIPVFAWGANARKIADFNTPSLPIFFRTIASVWRTAFVFGALVALLFLVALVGIRYYVELFHGLLGLLLASFIFWFLVVSLLSLQWVIPFYFLQEENSLVKSVKKGYIIFFDNPVFSLVIFAYNLLLLAISVVLFFLVPGASGMTLAATNALRLRLYKYDWIERMNETDSTFASNRRHAAVPWSELLAEDKEALGPRPLRSFLFPWK